VPKDFRIAGRIHNVGEVCWHISKKAVFRLPAAFPDLKAPARTKTGRVLLIG